MFFSENSSEITLNKKAKAIVGPCFFLKLIDSEIISNIVHGRIVRNFNGA